MPPPAASRRPAPRRRRGGSSASTYSACFGRPAPGRALRAAIPSVTTIRGDDRRDGMAAGYGDRRSGLRLELVVGRGRRRRLAGLAVVRRRHVLLAGQHLEHPAALELVRVVARGLRVQRRVLVAVPVGDRRGPRSRTCGRSTSACRRGTTVWSVNDGPGVGVGGPGVGVGVGGGRRGRRGVGGGTGVGPDRRAGRHPATRPAASAAATIERDARRGAITLSRATERRVDRRRGRQRELGREREALEGRRHQPRPRRLATKQARSAASRISSSSSPSSGTTRSRSTPTTACASRPRSSPAPPTASTAARIRSADRRQAQSASRAAAAAPRTRRRRSGTRRPCRGPRPGSPRRSRAAAGRPPGGPACR